MIWDEIVSVCWFAVPICIGFVVGPVRGVNFFSYLETNVGRRLVDNMV